MLDLVLHYEAELRVVLVALAFTALSWWEWAAPRRMLLLPKARRSLSNLALALVNVVAVRFVAPAAAVGIAALAEKRGSGLLHAVPWPESLEILVAVAVLDAAIYFQHVMFHAVPLLWRLHRVHHADLDFDLTTGARFHPVEMLLSLGIKAGVIFALGAPVAAVLVFEIALNLASLFNHANIRIAKRADTLLRTLLVTPDMHRVHHSVHRDETARNFGFCLPWWDYIFGTYRAQPRNGHEQMQLGIATLRDARHTNTLNSMLIMPFARDRDVDPRGDAPRTPSGQLSA